MENLIWFRKNGGNWNSDPTANPTTATGGVSMGSITINQMYASIQGASLNLIANFGATPFTYTVPSGFTSGWPAAAGGFTTFDPARSSATIIDGNLHVTGDSTGTQIGISKDYQTSGKFYWEYENVFNSLFTRNVGGGIRQTIFDNNWGSGAGLVGGGIETVPQFNANVYVGDVDSHVSAFPQLNNDIISVAVQFAPSEAPIVRGTGFANPVTVSIIQDAQIGLGKIDCYEFNDEDVSRDVTLRISTNSGVSWSNGRVNTLGRPGAYNTVLQWQKLGQARRMDFEISWETPINTTLVNLFVNNEVDET